MRSAFVSHSTSDDRYVAEMESFLRAAGFDEVFNDVSSIRPDEEFWPEIEKDIAKCEALVVVITFASSASEWVKREVECARGLSKKIIPVWMEDCPIPSIFSGRDVIDFRPGTREERRYEISRIDKYVPAELIGRENETKLLNDAWEKVRRLEKGRPHLLTFVALGGEGKTSLVAKWAAELAHQDWPGCDAAFAWSFYSQGAREQVAASSDLFLKEALTFFGGGADKEFAAGPAGAFEKGQRLARLVGQRRSLLILDGLEPLQYAPTSPTPGQLKDQGIAALLKGLAAASHGLCVVTTRYSLPDLKVFWQTTASEVKLPRLSRDAGVYLLKTLGVGGATQEFETLVEDVKGHALTLQIMGGFLQRAFGGDIRQRDRVKFEKADEKIDGGHAFRAMAAYVKSMEDGSDEARRELAVLRCLGLFDRPATRDCLEALLQPPAIAGLTESLTGVAQDDWQFSLDALDRANLLSRNRDPSGALLSLDTHPHIREYFAKQLREKNPDAWRAAHRRLYEHLCATTPDKPQPTLEDLQPLYQAVAHGCQAGLQQQTYDEVYLSRINRGHEVYGTHKLGAFGSDLGAIFCFFEPIGRRPSLALAEVGRAWLLSAAAFDLRALGRLNEALDPMRAGVDLRIKQKDWKAAADDATTLSEMELTLGEVVRAVKNAENSESYADRSGDAFQRMVSRTAYADALHHLGRRTEAEILFHEAEKMQPESRPGPLFFFSLRGFQYCDLLLTTSERAAWQLTLPSSLALPISNLVQSCNAVSLRAAQALKIAERNNWLLDIALDHLTLGRIALYRMILTGSEARSAESEVEKAVERFRRAGTQHMIPLGLLTRAWCSFAQASARKLRSDAQEATRLFSRAQEDLDEAWEIAERGPMKLFMADIHLYRARLFGRPNDKCRMTKYPWESPAADLAAAEKLINDCGYHRRDEELADAKAAILAT